MHSTAWSMISLLQQFQSSMQKIRLNSSQCLFAREKTFLMQSWLGFHNSCFLKFYVHPFAEFAKKFVFIPVVQYLCFIVCVHRFFHSSQVFWYYSSQLAQWHTTVCMCWIDIVAALPSFIHYLTTIGERREQVSMETIIISWVFLSLNLLFRAACLTRSLLWLVLTKYVFCLSFW